MKWIYGYKQDGFMWFRIFGWGLVIKDTHNHALLFSERNGFTKYIMIGKWIIRLLKPNEP